MEVPGVLVSGLGISKACNTILWIFQGWSFVLSGISRGKKKIKNSRGVFRRVCPQPPSVWGFFWNSSLQSLASLDGGPC